MRVRKRLGLFLITAVSLVAQDLATVEITRTPQGPVVNADFMGLSIQQNVAATYFGPQWRPNHSLFYLLQNLGTGTLRIGGHAADYSCWDGQPAPAPAICRYTVTAADFNSWATASSQTGWPMIIGVNLAQNLAPGAPDYILNEVTQALLPVLAHHPRASLLGLELGNELNLYVIMPQFRPPTYGVDGQTSDLLSYINAFKGNPATQNIKLVAPSYYNPSTSTVTAQLDPVLTNVLKCSGCSPSNLGLVTLHEYPLSIAKGPVTVEQLLSDTLLQQVEQNFAKAVGDVASMFGLPVQIGETNSTVPDPGQPGVSDVQASALWALDYALDMARIGIRRINFHIHDGSVYDPLVISSPSPGVYVNEVRPEFYGMFAFNAAKGKQFLPISVASSANIRAYALSQCATCATVVYLINKDLSAAGNVKVTLSTPGTSAYYFELAAPSLTSTVEDVRYGGVQFNTQIGMLNGPVQKVRVQPDGSGTYTVTLDNAAAGILTILP